MVFSQADHLPPASMYVVLREDIFENYFTNLRKKYFINLRRKYFKNLSRYSDEVVLIAIFTSISPTISCYVSIEERYLGKLFLTIWGEFIWPNLRKNILSIWGENILPILSRASDEVVLIAIFTSWSPSTSHFST